MPDPETSTLLSLDDIRAITRELVTRMSTDMMIGFFFSKVDLERLAELEHQHAARLLGHDVAYEGRPLEAAHFPRRIFGGQFDRRVVLLRETLARHHVPDAVRDHWLAHTEAQRDRVVQPSAPDCG